MAYVKLSKFSIETAYYYDHNTSNQKVVQVVLVVSIHRPTSIFKTSSNALLSPLYMYLHWLQYKSLTYTGFIFDYFTHEYFIVSAVEKNYRRQLPVRLEYPYSETDSWWVYSFYPCIIIHLPPPIIVNALVAYITRWIIKPVHHTSFKLIFPQVLFQLFSCTHSKYSAFLFFPHYNHNLSR